MTMKKQRIKNILLDPGFIFNTGYLGTFASLMPLLGPLPFGVMALNWLCGSIILSQKTGFFPVANGGFIRSEGWLGRFLARDNAALATNGFFLLVTGATIIVLAVFRQMGLCLLAEAGCAPTGWAELLTGRVTFSALLAFGFGLSNLKKASELDGAFLSLDSLPGLKHLRSEVIVALSSFAACLMTGGWSLLTAPLILYAMKMGGKRATNPASMAYRLTRWMAQSPVSPLPFRLKQNLYRQHPLTIARAVLALALLVSVLVGLVTFLARSLAAGGLIPTGAEFATLGNIAHMLASLRLYHLTDQSCGDWPKT